MEKNMSLLLNCNEFVNQKKYWVSKLDGKLEETNFLPYISKGNAASRSFKIKETYINEELVKRMKKISKESDLALFTILIAAMKGLIYKYTNKEDITISSPIYINNIDEDTINEIVPIIDKINDEMSFKDLILMEANTLSEAYNNQSYPQDVIWNELNGEDDIKSTLLNICCSLNTIHAHSELIKNECDILFSFIIDNNKLKFDLIYDENVYSEYLADEIKIRYIKILDDFTGDTNAPIKKFQLLGAKEFEKIINEFNNTSEKYNKEITIQEVFEKQVKNKSDEVAIVYEDNEKLNLWPSLGEYFLYDELLYKAMTHDKLRNEIYSAAIEKTVKGKVALDIGTGADAVLARMCVQHGAEKVYAIEVMEESYIKAKELISKLQLEDKIILIYGDSMKIELPEKVDVCVSEILGMIGGSEGVAVVLNDARRFLKEDGIMIPERSISKIAAVTLPEDFEDKMGFSELGQKYVAKLFNEFKSKFDFRVCVEGFSDKYVISNSEIFEDLNFKDIVECEKEHDITLKIQKDSRIHGFIVWLNLHTMDGYGLNVLNDKSNWLPVYVPAFHKGIEVKEGDIIKAKCIRKICKNSVNPDYIINGVLIKEDGNRIEFVYELPHYEDQFMKNDFYKDIFNNNEVKLINSRGIKKSITYKVLNERVNKLANHLREAKIQHNEMVALCGEPSLDMIIAMLGVIKAGGAYVPINPEYPKDRIKYIINEINAKVLLTHKNMILKDEYNLKVIDVDDKYIDSKNSNNPPSDNKSGDLAYVIYTSGTTGNPKGVMIEHKSVVNLSEWFNKEHNLEKNKNIMQMSNIAFDVSVEEIMGTLLNGATVFIPNQEIKLNAEGFSAYVNENDINLVQFVPVTLKEILLSQNKLESLKVIICGGEKLDEDLKNKILDKGYNLYNHYGPTETTVDALNIMCDYKHNSLGKPIMNTQVYVLDEENKPLPIGITGELCISGDGLARGYHNNKELTDKVFINNPFIQGENLYKTGDLVRWTTEGTIEFIGRRDNQVKIRGLRIELDEIESNLSKFSDLNEVTVDIKEYLGENIICAYFCADSKIDIQNLREFLSVSLPQHMIPSYFIQINNMPITYNGKIDKRKLPLPNESDNNNIYVPPSNDIERELINIWKELLLIKNIGVNDNFFNNGGHSLKATNLVSKIYKQFNVQIQLRDIFELNTIKLQAEYIMNSSKTTYTEIQPSEKKEYYKLSSAQKRLYLLDQFENIDTSYNMLHTIIIEGNVDKKRLENAFQSVIKRQEILRTSFEFINGEAVQKIHEDVNFKIINMSSTEEELPSIIRSFTKKFNLNEAPLLRVTLIELGDMKYALLLDMHHIISDGTSMGILIKEIIETYEGSVLPELKIQYKDYSEWQNKLLQDGSLDKQKEHWLKKLSGEIPILNLPTDYKRGGNLDFKGDFFSHKVSRDLVDKIRSMEKKSKSTLYMILLSAYSTLFYKYTSQEDILVGSPIAGRKYVELDNIIGMFVNTLVMRNFPKGDKTFNELLKEVSENALEAYANQDYQFEELVDNLEIKRELNRNPLFDVALTVQNTYEPKIDTDKLGFSFRDLEAENKTSKFDITLFVVEKDEDINFIFEYNTNLFKSETIEKMLVNYLKIIEQACNTPNIKLDEIDILSEEEKNKLMDAFNDTYSEYPRDKGVHELFMEQAKKTPNKVAVVDGVKVMTYKEIDIESNKLANYLIDQQNVKMGSFVGILMDKSIDNIITIMGILKTGAAYVPIDPEYPEERIKKIINDSKISTIISCKKRINILNKLQWECQYFKTYLCMDTDDVYSEYEQENILMSEELWKYVGDISTDEITGGGWGNSYTGEDLGKEEMDEYGDNILKKLKSYLKKDTKVLEIGCASGISMFRIAPHVGLYYGTDLSETIIEKDKERVIKENIKNIKLKAVPAHEIDKIEESDFDIVILNSVIQTFSGYNYLRDVISKITDKMSDKGIIFIGDIMDQDLKGDLIQSLVTFKEQNQGKGYRTKIDWSSELFISRDFFEDLRSDYKYIKNIDFSNKIYTIDNELTRYRYDAILNINKNNDIVIKTKNKYQLGRNIIEEYNSNAIFKKCNGNDLYCVIYTSGSTGNPKGTLITHRNVVRVVKNTNYIELTESDILLQLANYAFDASLFEIHGALLNGGKLVLVNKETALDIIKLTEIISKERITVTFLTTALFNTIIDTDISCFNNIRKILFGGERISVNHAKKALDYLGQDRLIHVYGPTESTVFATYYCINNIEEDDDNVPIGRPIANTKVYVMKDNKLQPIGIPGELCISGDGIVKGYLNNEELTNKKFIKDPFENDRIMYKTGDIVRWLDNGEIEFLDRIDQQVKIRGFRIELGEIESILIRHESIAEAIVIDKEDEVGNKYLCAYFVSNNDLKDEDIVKYLSKELPNYMIPKNYVKLEKFPINANGKINKKALLEIECKNIKSQNYEGPKDNVEKQVLEIWYEILGIKNIGVNEKFFDVGGHSLKAAIMANKIYGRFNVSFPLSDLFKNPSVREVSDKIKQIIENSANEEYLNNEEIILLKQGKNKTKNIFFVHSAVNAVECYAKLSKHLNQDFNCWGIKATQVELYSAQKIQVEEIAKDYVQRIKKIQPNGPYYISGWCIAGIIAYEIAKQLENMNDKVEFLGLINSPLVKQESIGLRFITKLKYIHEKEGVVLKKVIRNTKFENKYKDNINKENVWDLFINELDSNDSYEIEKEIIFNNICLYEPSCRNLFSNYKSMELKEMLLKFNIMRSLINAIYCNYSLREKINANIYYYVAGKDKIKNMELWKNHTNKSLIVHYIDSKHFEIFDGEECSCLGDKFNESIS